MRSRPIARGGRDPSQARLLDIGEHEFRAGLREGARQMLAETAGGSGDQYTTALKVQSRPDRWIRRGHLLARKQAFVGRSDLRHEIGDQLRVRQGRARVCSPSWRRVVHAYATLPSM